MKKRFLLDVVMCVLMIVVLVMLVKWGNKQTVKFNPRADENSEGQCP